MLEYKIHKLEFTIEYPDGTRAIRTLEGDSVKLWGEHMVSVCLFASESEEFEKKYGKFPKWEELEWVETKI